MAKTENSKKNGYIDSQPDMENDNSIYAYPNLSVNKDGIIVYANGDVSRILGYSRQELIGMEAAKFYFKPSERKKFLKKLYSEGEVHDYNLTFKTKDGKKVSCEIDMAVFKDSEGNVIGHTGILKDIKLETELRLKLEKDNKKLFSVLEQLPAYVCLYDNDRNIVYANKYLRQRFKKYKDKKCYEVFHGKDMPCEKCPILGVFSSGIPAVFQTVQLDNKTYEVHDYPFTDVEGNKLVLELGINITDRIKAEERLREANEALEIMNKVLRHDILNDLNIALNFCDLIATQDEDIKQRVMNTISKCVELIENTGELERAFNRKIDSNGIKLSDIRTKIKELSKNYPELKINTIGNCKIIVDESISTVFDNIVRNAKVHGKANNIDISLKKEGKNCEIWISDDGVGIPDKYKDKIFNEGFSQGPNKGLGLGLYISKKIMEMQGGEIEVRDNNPNGSIFILRFKSDDIHEIC